MLKIQTKTLILTLVFLFLLPIATMGSGLVPCTDNCTIEQLFDLPNIVIDFVIDNIVPGIVMIGIGWAAVIMMTSAGDPAKFQQAKRTITYIAVGLIVISLSWTLVQWFITAIGGNPSTIFP
ncbi:MAG: hypothetical protein PHD31_02420 [Candidatus Pacebacteria bacterium]|nr:hypothetical protein [Candidatus Paceibacterota bacterium]